MLPSHLALLFTALTLLASRAEDIDLSGRVIESLSGIPAFDPVARAHAYLSGRTFGDAPPGDGQVRRDSVPIGGNRQVAPISASAVVRTNCGCRALRSAGCRRTLRPVGGIRLVSRVLAGQQGRIIRPQTRLMLAASVPRKLRNRLDGPRSGTALAVLVQARGLERLE